MSKTLWWVWLLGQSRCVIFPTWPLTLTEALADRPHGVKGPSHPRSPAQPVCCHLWRVQTLPTGDALTCVCIPSLDAFMPGLFVWDLGQRFIFRLCRLLSMGRSVCNCPPLWPCAPRFSTPSPTFSYPPPPQGWSASEPLVQGLLSSEMPPATHASAWPCGVSPRRGTWLPVSLLVLLLQSETKALTHASLACCFNRKLWCLTAQLPLSLLSWTPSTTHSRVWVCFLMFDCWQIFSITPLPLMPHIWSSWWETQMAAHSVAVRASEHWELPLWQPSSPLHPQPQFKSFPCFFKPF